MEFVGYLSKNQELLSLLDVTLLPVLCIVLQLLVHVFAMIFLVCATLYLVNRI